ncbi:MAG: NAD-binding protein [Bilophila wadsworthia]
MGFHIAQRLSEEQKQVVVIDQNPDKLRRIETTWTQTVLGPLHPIGSQNAGRDAAIFLAVTDSDETNIVACLFANTIAPKAMKLARYTEEYTAYPQLLGSGSLQISMLINPEQEIVRSIERLLTLPGAVEYGQLADGFIRMVGMRVESGPLIEQPLTRFREIVQDDGIMVGAIARGQKLIVPSGSDVIKAGDTVYFAYKPTSQRALLRALHKTRRAASTACIVGGGNIGLRLARLLENRRGHQAYRHQRGALRTGWRTSCRVRWSCTATARTSPSCRKSILIRWTPSSR